MLEVANDGVIGAGHRAGMGLRLAAFEALQSGGVVEFGTREPGTWQVRLVVPDADSATVPNASSFDPRADVESRYFSQL